MKFKVGDKVRISSTYMSMWSNIDIHKPVLDTYTISAVRDGYYDLEEIPHGYFDIGYSDIWFERIRKPRKSKRKDLNLAPWDKL